PLTRPFLSTAGPPESPEQTGLLAMNSPAFTISVWQAAPSQYTLEVVTLMRCPAVWPVWSAGSCRPKPIAENTSLAASWRVKLGSIGLAAVIGTPLPDSSNNAM